MPIYALLLTLALPAFSQSSITPEMDKYLMEGIDSIFRMDFDAAERASLKVVELNPEHPYGHFAGACAVWTRYVYETEQTDQALIAPIEKSMHDAIEKSRLWLKTHPKDALVLMVQGSAYGLLSRLLVMRRQWLSAYFSGRKAVGITRAAVKADPGLVDAQLGLGMFDYYTDLYPRFIGILAKVVLRGDRLRGIETLKKVASDGHYSKVSAQMILVEIYNNDPLGAKNPEEALRILSSVRARYPDSAMLHAAELVSLYEAKRYEEAVRGAQSYLKLVAEKKYRPIELAKGSVIMGTTLWALGRKEEALRHLKTGAEVKLGDVLSRWAVWAHIRAGNLEDAMGLRQEALADYKIAAAVPDHWGMRAAAKAHVSKPFKEIDGHPGPIQSPD